MHTVRITILSFFLLQNQGSFLNKQYILQKTMFQSPSTQNPLELQYLVRSRVKRNNLVILQVILVFCLLETGITSKITIL
jgi:hypothetical protein